MEKGVRFGAHNPSWPWAESSVDGEIWIWDATPGFKRDRTPRPAPSSPPRQTKP